MKIAVTGKIGSGKSSLAKELARLLAPQGYLLIDVDSLTALCHQDPEFQRQTLALFGTLDRTAISQASFADPAKLAALEQASLPVWTQLLASATRSSHWIVDFPLLLETQILLADCDLCVGVDAQVDARRQRACSRLGWDSFRFAQADAQQMGSRSKMAFCDLALSNDGPPEDLAASAMRLALNVRALDKVEPRALPLVGRAAWRSIVRSHCEAHRRYHGGAHLDALFNAIDPRFADDPSCSLAILYHDKAYDTGARYAMNESDSCKALSRDSRDHFPHVLDMPSADAPACVALACAMIDCTRGHAVLDPWLLESPSRLERAQAFLDADLSILGGASERQFEAYDIAIGEEFSEVERPLYHRLRAEAMQSFLDRPKIYLTDRCSAWETTARRRIAALAAKHLALANPSQPSSPGE